MTSLLTLVPQEVSCRKLCEVRNQKYRNEFISKSSKLHSNSLLRFSFRSDLLEEVLLFSNACSIFLKFHCSKPSFQAFDLVTQRNLSQLKFQKILRKKQLSKYCAWRDQIHGRKFQHRYDIKVTIYLELVYRNCKPSRLLMAEFIL